MNRMREGWARDAGGRWHYFCALDIVRRMPSICDSVAVVDSATTLLAELPSRILFSPADICMQCRRQAARANVKAPRP